MKNLTYFPCERNNYFYGKLLSVDDFESEQRYMNDKRRLINRFMHGCGVVCGLGVIAVDDDTVSLEAGIALDFEGREIIVESPKLMKLDEIDGFSFEENHGGSCRYLCIEYLEYEKDPVYGVAGGSKEGGHAYHNKIAEGYRISLTTQEPGEGSGITGYYEEKTQIYQGNGIQICQIFPRYVNSGEEFTFRLVVENMGQKNPFSFGYELGLEYLEKDGKKWTKLIFDENEREKLYRYEISYTLRAAGADNVKGRAVIKKDSFWIKVGEQEAVYPYARDWIQNAGAAESGQIVCVTQITEENIGKIVSRQYFSHAMEEITNPAYQQLIYLAKINLITAGNTVVIEEVEQMPFGQYIVSDVLSLVRERAQEAEKKRERKAPVEQSVSAAKERIAAQSDFCDMPQVAEGKTKVRLGLGGLAGQTFFSPPLVHGLGLGHVAVWAGLSSGEKQPYSCYGDISVFKAEGDQVNAAVAVRVDEAKGSFVIGIRLAEPTDCESVTVNWTAMRVPKAEDGKQKEGELFIKPDMAYLSLREEYCFKAVYTGTEERQIRWSVREAIGGAVDKNGMYTAPNKPGIYEILAEDERNPKLSASAFAVVRDTRHPGNDGESK